MAWKQHCDLCDAVIPAEEEAVYVVPKDRYHTRDWKHDDPRVSCMACVAAFLPAPAVLLPAPPPERIV